MEWHAEVRVQMSMIGSMYSSVLLLDGADGSQTLFTVPQGQNILTLGKPTDVKRRVSVPQYQRTHSEYTTNVTRAGEFGSTFGNAMLRKICARVERGSEGIIQNLKASLRVHIGGRRMAWCNDVAGIISTDEKDRYQYIELMVNRTDTFDVVLRMAAPLRLKKPTLLWIEFDADFSPVEP